VYELGCVAEAGDTGTLVESRKTTEWYHKNGVMREWDRYYSNDEGRKCNVKDIDADLVMWASYNVLAETTAENQGSEFKVRYVWRSIELTPYQDDRVTHLQEKCACPDQLKPWANGKTQQIARCDPAGCEMLKRLCVEQYNGKCSLTVTLRVFSKDSKKVMERLNQFGDIPKNESSLPAKLLMEQKKNCEELDGRLCPGGGAIGKHGGGAHAGVLVALLVMLCHWVISAVE